MSRRSHTRGVSLIEALVALLILSIGMLAMTRIQARVFAQGSEAQHRLLANRLASELLDLALIDAAANTRCYALPAPTDCTTTAAGITTERWRAAVAASGLPLTSGSPTATLSGTTFTVSMRWTGRVVAEGVAAETHQLTRSTDVR
jgi:type IV pilus assembly protein PilV